MSRYATVKVGKKEIRNVHTVQIFQYADFQYSEVGRKYSTLQDLDKYIFMSCQTTNNGEHLIPIKISNYVRVDILGAVKHLEAPQTIIYGEVNNASVFKELFVEGSIKEYKPATKNNGSTRTNYERTVVTLAEHYKALHNSLGRANVISITGNLFKYEFRALNIISETQLSGIAWYAVSDYMQVKGEVNRCTTKKLELNLKSVNLF